jgi:plastocyanin
MSKRHLPAISVLVLAALLLAACGTDTGTTTTTPSGTTTGTGEFQVNIDGFTFVPAELTVPVGTTVTWTNNHAASHTVTSDTGVFDSDTMVQRATFTFTFTEAGEFPYHCSFHSSMTATVVVAG